MTGIRKVLQSYHTADLNRHATLYTGESLLTAKTLTSLSYKFHSFPKPKPAYSPISTELFENVKQPTSALASVVQWFGALSRRPKGHGFRSQSGHMPRLQVQSLLEMHTRGN